MDNINEKILDISSIHWGAVPAPLFPSSLRSRIEDSSLPSWVCAEIGCPESCTASVLDGRAWEDMTEMSPRLGNFLARLFKNHWTEFPKVRCVDRTWPAGLKIADVGFAVRTRNALLQAGMLDDPGTLLSLNFKDLMGMYGLGTKSALDFCCTLEAAIDAYTRLISTYIGDREQDAHSEGVSLDDVAREPWAAQVSSKDPRFAAWLPPGEGTLQDRAEAHLSEPHALNRLADLPAIEAAIPAIKNVIRDLSSKPLEQCLVEFLSCFTRDRGDRLDTLAARFGWNGNAPLTLEESGARLSITRERVRQIQSSIEKKFPAHEVCMPQLDRALSVLEKEAPISEAEAEELLLRHGISKVRFHPRSILSAAETLHKDTHLEIINTPRGRFIAYDDASKTVRLIQSVARKLSGQSGASNIYQVRDQLSTEVHDVSLEEVKRCLSGDTNNDFLSEDWFWDKSIPLHRNRLRNVVRRMLSVVAPQDVTSLRQGVRRSYRFRSSGDPRFATLVVPPHDVLRIFLDRHPEFRVEGDLVTPSYPLEYAGELGEIERAVVEVLRSSPTGVLDRASFAEGCLERGVNENSFSLYSSYSPVIEHLGINMWKLRGFFVDPAAVEAIRRANNLKPRMKRVLEYGWSEDGKLWIAAIVPKLNRQSMVLGCPAAIARYLTGRNFRCLTKEEGLDCGTVTVNDSAMSYGYGVFIRRMGIDENDVLLAEFDLSESTVTLSVGADELLEEDL